MILNEILQIFSKVVGTSAFPLQDKLNDLHPVVYRMEIPDDLSGTHFYLESYSEEYGKEEGWISDSLLKRVNCQ